MSWPVELLREQRLGEDRDLYVCADWADIAPRLAPAWLRARKVTGAFVMTSAVGTGQHLCTDCLDAREYPDEIAALCERNKPDADGVGGFLIYDVRLADEGCCIGGWGGEESEYLSCAECARRLTR